MKIVSNAQAMQKLSRSWHRAGETVGLVPTMGALHRGHMTLVETARKQNDRVVVSIYVNPTQFGPKEDFGKYPRPRREDLALCRAAGVDAVLAPETLYPPDFSTWVEETVQSKGRCAVSRPIHFRGVATVVLKLLNTALPDRAYFGRKDAQQVDVIERMVRDLDVPVKIVPVEIVRDSDGLALSSRNRYLSPEQRQQALILPHSLREAVKQKQPVAWLRRVLSRAPGMKVDYVESANGRLCAAVWVGKTRLIDNVKI
jgi:pantoate--beta-alanine ligase